jgi:hypothetical protein
VFLRQALLGTNDAFVAVSAKVKLYLFTEKNIQPETLPHAQNQTVTDDLQLHVYHPSTRTGADYQAILAKMDYGRRALDFTLQEA